MKNVVYRKMREKVETIRYFKSFGDSLEAIVIHLFAFFFGAEI